MHVTHKVSLALALLTAGGLVSARPASAGINGFNGGTGFTFNESNANGLPAVSGGTATLTDGGGYEATSLFYDTAQNVNTFSVDFTYQPNGSGDGFAFVLQNDPRGASALGQYGGYLGYGGSGAITPSAAVEFNVYSPNGVGTDLKTNGTTFSYNGTGPVSLASGDPIHVHLFYDGTTLGEALTDTTTGATYDTSYATDLAGVVGGPTAFVGFSGGTGAATSTQTISDFHLAPVPEASTTVSLGLLLCLGLGGLAFQARRKAPAGE